MAMFEGKSVLVTGGTGSFGRRFVRRVLAEHPGVRRLIVFSRDELKQHDMSREPGIAGHPAIRFFLGDVRDPARLMRAFDGVDIVIHAAALKQVPAAEYNPFEFIKTNILGAQNVIEACIDRGVARAVALSTDKAAAPANLYGATKLCSDKLFIAANNVVGARPLRFTVVRYGNVLGSRGSVVPLFLKLRSAGRLPITDPAMTRFSLTLDDAVDMVLHALAHGVGGEILVPKIPSYRILDLAEAIAPECSRDVIGIRPGEKIHEEMVVPADSGNTVDLGRYFAILPSRGGPASDELRQRIGGKPVPGDFHYTSGTNERFLTVGELRTLIRDHVQPEFD
jgi:UDP-N-acetylglucosamine 4,6-dehydratase (inverting)